MTDMYCVQSKVTSQKNEECSQNAETFTIKVLQNVFFRIIHILNIDRMTSFCGRFI